MNQYWIFWHYLSKINVIGVINDDLTHRILYFDHNEWMKNSADYGFVWFHYHSEFIDVSDGDIIEMTLDLAKDDGFGFEWNEREAILSYQLNGKFVYDYWCTGNKYYVFHSNV